MELREKERADRMRARLAWLVAAYAFGVTEAELSSERSSRAVRARQVAMYLAHVALEMSLGRVATALACDRSTVAYACHRIEDRRDDAAFDDWLNALEASIRAAPLPVEGLAKARAA